MSKCTESVLGGLLAFGVVVVFQPGGRPLHVVVDLLAFGVVLYSEPGRFFHAIDANVPTGKDDILSISLRECPILITCPCRCIVELCPTKCASLHQ